MGFLTGLRDCTSVYVRMLRGLGSSWAMVVRVGPRVGEGREIAVDAGMTWFRVAGTSKWSSGSGDGVS